MKEGVIVKNINAIIEAHMSGRREGEANFPWDIVTKLVSLIVEKHAEITLIFTNQIPQLLEEAQLQLPEEFSAGDIAGHANPLLIEVRADLKKIQS